MKKEAREAGVARSCSTATATATASCRISRPLRQISSELVKPSDLFCTSKAAQHSQLQHLAPPSSYAPIFIGARPRARLLFIGAQLQLAVAQLLASLDLLSLCLLALLVQKYKY
jgi:hypothetical protein